MGSTKKHMYRKLQNEYEKQMLVRKTTEQTQRLQNKLKDMGNEMLTKQVGVRNPTRQDFKDQTQCVLPSRNQ
jgi:hypothetical protein